MADRVEKKIILGSDLGGNVYDYAIGEDGDFVKDESYDTDIVISLFCDGRANESDIAEPERRRGWHGDVDSSLLDYFIGSKLWLLGQARMTQQTANEAKSHAEEALRWITKKGIAERVLVTASTSGVDTIIINVRFYIGNTITFKSSYELWKNSEIPTGVS